VSGKRCTSCGQFKQAEAFHFRRNGHLASWCKECAIRRSHEGRGRGFWHRQGRRRHAHNRRPVAAPEVQQEDPHIASLRLVNGHCGYSYPRGHIRCWRGEGTCAKPRFLCCPWLAGAWGKGRHRR
jgi:hypothetical protein